MLSRTGDLSARKEVSEGCRSGCFRRLFMLRTRKLIRSVSTSPLHPSIPTISIFCTGGGKSRLTLELIDASQPDTDKHDTPLLHLSHPAAALVTYGPRDADRFYSNGLDLPLAMRTPMFFPRILNALLGRILTFPIPTIAAINGHAFAGGFTLALAHDFRVMKNEDGRFQKWLCMNEVGGYPSYAAGT